MSAHHTHIPSLDAIADFVGKPLGPSEWVTVPQERIDDFAEVTGDRQWIHCDVERARRESPWQATIAHGYLTLALAPGLLGEIVTIAGWKTVVNSGIDKLRFSAPVPSGSRVRLHAEIDGARSLRGRGVRVTFALRLEVEGAAKPAFTARVHYAYMAEDPAG